MAVEFDSSDQAVAEAAGQPYSPTVIDHATRPRNLGSLANADGMGCITGPCGDTMKIWLRVEGERIVQATFWTDGCGTTLAAGSMVTELARGKSIRAALEIGQQEVLQALGGLPEESRHCALLAANTLKEAVRDYLALKAEPWKKAYRR
ncbi:MAG: iron-sulfur cluster assembly scaffold protein [Clostridia bacterium]|nr:iron-sulfur cluster assembly scaffold protein [Clostridia bacterium]MDH7572856.1 iron-sulfur cluster assembly scaffold protein [Clostridia bacterium]